MHCKHHRLSNDNGIFKNSSLISYIIMTCVPISFAIMLYINLYQRIMPCTQEPSHLKFSISQPVLWSCPVHTINLPRILRSWTRWTYFILWIFDHLCQYDWSFNFEEQLATSIHHQACPSSCLLVLVVNKVLVNVSLFFLFRTGPQNLRDRGSWVAQLNN
jgi:hypothetical protein